jgi:hypothetical protein
MHTTVGQEVRFGSVWFVLENHLQGMKKSLNALRDEGFCEETGQKRRSVETIEVVELRVGS